MFGSSCVDIGISMIKCNLILSLLIVRLRSLGNCRLFIVNLVSKSSAVYQQIACRLYLGFTAIENPSNLFLDVPRFPDGSSCLTAPIGSNTQLLRFQYLPKIPKNNIPKIQLQIRLKLLIALVYRIPAWRPENHPNGALHTKIIIDNISTKTVSDSASKIGENIWGCFHFSEASE